MPLSEIITSPPPSLPRSLSGASGSGISKEDTGGGYGKVSTRAWIWQERLLAERTIFFTPSALKFAAQTPEELGGQLCGAGPVPSSGGALPSGPQLQLYGAASGPGLQPGGLPELLWLGASGPEARKRG
ncbi:hypothetical protein VE01_01842 [Pseudogymnoascus verrucosus]|uniref:Uncharacterized protein n=1 Tax=Pseudogymnoascus verrucosus TaxID=342668 RepID=A0A1B8GWJ6_9PEZI|nr:uncharacterized protein VE01_01842 [Pseudogymnoascus verrucosus]OBU00198.1 hypothetical protein VE01_01842 [Pseudogymnoascus verrucosus]